MIRGGIPASPGTSFVGRERELAALAEAVGVERLLTLHGPGGAGKTRLAVELIDRVAPTGALFADLGPLARGSAVWPSLAQLVDLREEPRVGQADAVVDALVGRGRQSRPCCAPRPNSRIAAVPFTLRNLKEDLEDVGSNFDGAPDLEFRLATKALELEQSGLSYQRIPPDYRFPYGHTHKEQEELYVVVRGSGRMKLDDEIVEVKEWDVVRVPPGTWRGYEAGPEGLEILVFGAPNLGEDPREDVEGQRDWWAD